MIAKMKKKISLLLTMSILLGSFVVSEASDTASDNAVSPPAIEGEYIIKYNFEMLESAVIAERNMRMNESAVQTETFNAVEGIFSEEIMNGPEDETRMTSDIGLDNTDMILTENAGIDNSTGMITMENTEVSDSMSITDRLNASEMFRYVLEDVQEFNIIDEIPYEDGSEKLSLVKMTSQDNTGVLDELNAMSCVEYAEPNYIITAAEDSEVSSQWGLGTASAFGIDIETAWNINQGSCAVMVAVIDTGIDISHTDLSSNIYSNSAETLDGTDNDENGYVDDIHGWDFTTYTDSQNNGDNSVYDGNIIDGENGDLHGTHVAGIIGALRNNSGMVGAAPNVTILPVKVLENESGTIFNAIKGIEYAQAMGADIANCSWGTYGYVRALKDCMENSSMLFVCAAGNEGLSTDSFPMYPAAFDLENVISVAATDSSMLRAV